MMNDEQVKSIEGYLNAAFLSMQEIADLVGVSREEVIQVMVEMIVEEEE